MGGRRVRPSELKGWQVRDGNQPNSAADILRWSLGEVANLLLDNHSTNVMKKTYDSILLLYPVLTVAFVTWAGKHPVQVPRG